MKRQLTALLYGWIIVFGIVLITSIILAFILRFSSLKEPTLSWVTLALGLITLFIGGIVAGIKGKSKGWIIGAIIGVGFTLFIFLVQFLGYQQSFTMQQSLHHLGYILAAIIGGVIGVNVMVVDHDK